jgi:cytochrome c-type biogenesis protein CcmH
MIRAALLALVLTCGVASAQTPAQEERARALDAEIRCVVCENEPISQSTAGMAADMRALVRERIAAGDTDAEIRAFFADRYGDFVLLRPRMSASTWALWAAPALLLVFAGFAAASLLRRRRAAGTADADLPAPEHDEDR